MRHADAQGVSMSEADPAYELLGGDRLSAQARDSVSRAEHDAARARMVANGIWMIYGTAPAYAASGLMDRGIQYLVLDAMAVRFMGAVSREIAMGLENPESNANGASIDENALDPFGISP